MLEIKSITVQYGSRSVLSQVSLGVKAGEIMAVIGPNGAGKSTLVRTISGVLTPTSGTVRINGQDLKPLSPNERARLLAVVPQAGRLPGAYTVYQTVLLGRTPHLNWLGQAGKSDHAYTHLALERTQTLSLANRRVGELSGGEQQRVLLARALAQDTPILLLDEPTTYLDLQYQSGFLNLLRQLAVDNRMAVLLVLHDLNLAGLYAHQVALFMEGSIYASGTPEQVLTSQNLSAVFNIPVNVTLHPDYGTPLVLPDGRANSPAQAATFNQGS